MFTLQIIFFYKIGVVGYIFFVLASGYLHIQYIKKSPLFLNEDILLA